MAEQLFPVFELPDIPIDDQEEEICLQSVKFDWKTGDFVRDALGRMVIADGHDAYIDWILKVSSTERLSCLAYDDDIGTEFEGIMQYNDNERIEADIERTLIDALMVHPATEYVRDFSFSWTADSVFVTFTVKGRPWPEDNGLRIAIGK